MDLNYTDANHEDVGVLLRYDLDMEIGGSEDFQLTLPRDTILEQKSFVYIDGSEVFAILDNVKVDTEASEIIYTGRTVRGLMDKKIISPLSGQDYRKVSGELSVIFNSFCTEFGISDFIVFEPTGITLSNYQIDRYVSMLQTLNKILNNHGKKLIYNYYDKQMHLSVKDIVDYTDEVEFGVNTNVDYTAERNRGFTNHLICLGQGDLAQRQVIHLYMDENGNVSNTQTFFGIDEIVEVYDYSNVESLEELRNGGTEKLHEEVLQSISVSVTGNDLSVGDIVGGFDSVTKISVKAAITSKVIKILDGDITVEYEVEGDE